MEILRGPKAISEHIIQILLAFTHRVELLFQRI